MEKNTNFGTFTIGGNFDPDTLLNDSSTFKLMTLIFDCSPSIEDYVADMNTAMQGFLGEMRSSHHGNDLVVNLITFSDDIETNFGFKPIKNVDNSDITISPRGRGTALYGAVVRGLQSHLDYRNQLEQGGGSVKSIVCIVTDGMDNCSIHDYVQVNDILNKIRKDEFTYNTFDIFMYGVGQPAFFEDARDKMGLKRDALATFGTSAKEMRKMITCMSQSVSSSTSATVVTF